MLVVKETVFRSALLQGCCCWQQQSWVGQMCQGELQHNLCMDIDSTQAAGLS